MSEETRVMKDGELVIADVDDGEEKTISTTLAQAKADAVNNLLAKALGNASMLRLTQEETEKLKAEFADDAFRGGAAGKENLIYIEHTHLRDRLDSVLGVGQAVLVPRLSWSEDFKTSKGQPGVNVYVQAMLIVRGCYITEAVGSMAYYPNNAGADYSDAFEGGETAAFRRCCKKFGVGLQAWSKTWCEGWWKRKAERNAAPQQQRPDVGQAAMKILLEAARKGTDYLAHAWEQIGLEARKACQHELPKLKETASKAIPREPGIDEEDD